MNFAACTVFSKLKKYLQQSFLIQKTSGLGVSTACPKHTRREVSGQALLKLHGNEKP